MQRERETMRDQERDSQWEHSPEVVDMVLAGALEAYNATSSGPCIATTSVAKSILLQHSPDDVIADLMTKLLSKLCHLLT